MYFFFQLVLLFIPFKCEGEVLPSLAEQTLHKIPLQNALRRRCMSGAFRGKNLLSFPAQKATGV